ncbi:MAG: hypothetical protein ACREKE_02600 [bacterium]
MPLNEKTALGVLSGTIIGVAVLWGAYSLLCVGLRSTRCDDRVIKVFPSPGGNWTATLFAQDCGLQEEHIGLAVARAGDNFDKEENSVVWCVGCDTDDISVQWNGNENVHVDWPGCAPWNLLSVVKHRTEPHVSYGEFAERKASLVGHWTPKGGSGNGLTFGSYSAGAGYIVVSVNGKDIKNLWGASGTRMHIGNKNYKYVLEANTLKLASTSDGKSYWYVRP